MESFRSRIAARLRPRASVTPVMPVTPAPAAALRAGVGEPPATPEAGEAELDTLRGELVRELDRIAADDSGSAAFRRVAS